MSISDETKALYLHQAGLLRSRFTRDFQQEPEADWDRFQAWMAGLYADLAPATRRLYHAALHCYQGIHHPECMPDPIPPGLPNRKAIRSEHGKRGPGQKAKLIPPHVENAILNALWHASHLPGASIYNTWAIAFLRAGMAFGLRPSEWRRARFVALEDTSVALHVINAKQSGGRAFGPTRTLVIDAVALTERDEEYAHWLIESSFHLTPEQFQDVLDRTAQQLYRVTRECGAPCRTRNGSITLYSARHQFAANAKLAGATLVELAALMGHASTETAARHYGRRQYGRSQHRMAVKPHSDNLQEVETIATHKKAHRQKSGPRGPGR